MTQGETVKAYIALCGITAEKWGVKDAYELWRLKKKLAEAFDFQAEREKAILDAHHAKPAKNGRWAFDSVEEKDAFQKELDELNGMEFPVEVKPVTVTPPEGMTIAPDTLGDLEGFVVFDIGGRG